MLSILRKYDKMSDADLMRRFQSDDAKAFEELFDRYNQRVLGFFIKFFGNREEAEDLCQDLFVRLVDRKHQFDVNKSFTPWLFTIASNMAKTYISKERRLRFADLEEDAHEEDVSEDRNELKLEIRSAVMQLDAVHKSTFILRHYTSLSIKEIASIQACKEGTVKSRLFTANRKIRELMNKQETYYNS
jgi:RNA polymerase sigma-70 factor (ECF subfamily)